MAPPATSTKSPGRNDPCPCGSGKKYKKCCLNSAQRVSPSVPSDTAALFSQAQNFFQQQNYLQASNLYRQIIELNPKHADAIHYRGLSLIQLGQVDLGIRSLHQSISLNPDDAIYCNNLALSLEKVASSKEVIEWYRRALTLKPDYIDSVFNFTKYLLDRKKHIIARDLIERYVDDSTNDTDLVTLAAEIYSKIGEFRLTKKWLKKALELDNTSNTITRVASINQNLGDMEEALAGYNQALKLDANNPDAMLKKADILERLSRLDESCQTAKQALSMFPKMIETNIIMARIFRRRKELDKAEECITRILPLPEATVNKQSYYRELGKILDSKGDYEGAFEAYEKASNFVSVEFRLGYDKNLTDRYESDRKAAFTPESIKRYKSLVSKDDSGPQPLFIVGFPRSGTTLTERILSNHPNVVAGDELQYMPNIEERICKTSKRDDGYPGCLKEVAERNPDSFTEARDYYLSSAGDLELRQGNHHWFTDKMPMNEARMGLIHILFPNSPIIHLVRHPLDSCLSTYFTELSHGRHCGLKLETTAYHYLHVFEKAKYYLTVADCRYLRVRYEDLVVDTETWARKMIKFIGEEWDERCLGSSNSTYKPRTASYAQVTEKIYDTSMFRYKNYRDKVEPIIPMLESVIKELGYEIE